MPLTIDQIIHLYRTEGASRYGREPVSQQEHALQCGLLAQEAEASPELVVAALLHDLGHLVVPVDPQLRDNRHEMRVQPFLRGTFSAAVLDPIRLHVAAKRYLCTIDPLYHAALSPASRSSLALQGGPGPSSRNTHRRSQRSLARFWRRSVSGSWQCRVSAFEFESYRNVI